MKVEETHWKATMTRFRAFAIHLTASATIFLIFLGIMFFVWYPAPYFAIDGGWQVLRILGRRGCGAGPTANPDRVQTG
jgi:hypothetical protein